MEIKNIFTELHENLVNKLIKNNTEEQLNEIQDRVAYDFIKYLMVKNGKISDIKYQELIRYIKVIALANNHNHVSQSDLVGLTYLLEKPYDDFDIKFYSALKDTMFKEMFNYLNINGDYKDSITDAFNNKTLTDEEKKHSGELANWSQKQFEYLSKSKSEIVNGPQLKNIITGFDIIEFYNKTIDELIARFKWQTLSFNIIKNT